MKLRPRRATTLVVVVLAVASAAATSSSAWSATTAGQPPTERAPFRWPFSVDSPWNTPIGSDATLAPADDPRTVDVTDPRHEIMVNAAAYSHPVYRANRGDPRVEVSFAFASVAPFVDGTVKYRIPAKAQPADGTDRHLHVLDLDGTTLHETWDFRRTGATGAAVGKYAEVDLCGTGLSTEPWDPVDDSNGGSRAYGGSGVAGLIRTWELDAGVIRHAVALALTNDQLKQGYVWPASSEDSTAALYAGSIPMGSLVVIPRDVDLDGLGLSRGGKILARALQDYGAYVVDRSDAVSFSAEPGAESHRRLAQMRRDLFTLRAELRVVTNNGPSDRGDPAYTPGSSPGGGGTTRASSAPAELSGCA